LGRNLRNAAAHGPGPNHRNVLKFQCHPCSS
jgi:hypothetical protein